VRSYCQPAITGLTALVLLPLLLACSCLGGTAEVRFPSGEFTIVGDLRLPDTEGPHPAIIMVSGDGNVNRTDGMKYRPLFDVFRRAGYAVLSWDKPGTGETIGQFGDGAWIITYRVDILLDAIDFLEGLPSIDAERIGAWGISQGGIVIPMALTKTDELGFAIIASGPGGDGIDQYGYLIGQYVLCEGGTEEEAELAESLFIATCWADTYQEWLEARTPLIEIPFTSNFVGTGIVPEDEWQPWNHETDTFFDPMSTIRETPIPILAFFGDLDKQVNPARGYENYEQALAAAGNPLSRVVFLDGADHNLVAADTGCISERDRRATCKWLRYAPEYLAPMGEWLLGLSEPPENSESAD